MESAGVGRAIELSIDEDRLVFGIVSVASGAETPEQSFFIGAGRQLEDRAIIQIIGSAGPTLIGGAVEIPCCINGNTCIIRVCAVLFGITLEAVDDLLRPLVFRAWRQLENISEVKVATLIVRAKEVAVCIHGQTRFGILSK